MTKAHDAGDEIDARARREVKAEERRLRQSRRKLTLGKAFATFVRQPSPIIIGTFLLASLIARLVVGGWGVADAVIVVAMFASFPLVEWLVHVVVLHWRPRRVGRFTVDTLLAQKHREHHNKPRDLKLVFIPWQILLVLVVLTTAVGMLAFFSVERGLTFMVTLGVIGMLYEWTHYLVHTDYRPKGRYYRSLWRSHRFHHYRSEHYWFTLTTAGTTDRLFGTYPDPETVEPSPTVKNLHALSQDG